MMLMIVLRGVVSLSVGRIPCAWLNGWVGAVMAGGGVFGSSDSLQDAGGGGGGTATTTTTTTTTAAGDGGGAGASTSGCGGPYIISYLTGLYKPRPDTVSPTHSLLSQCNNDHTHTHT